MSKCIKKPIILGSFLFHSWSGLTSEVEVLFCMWQSCEAEFIVIILLWEGTKSQSKEVTNGWQHCLTNPWCANPSSWSWQNHQARLQKENPLLLAAVCDTRGLTGEGGALCRKLDPVRGLPVSADSCVLTHELQFWLREVDKLPKTDSHRTAEG